MIALAFYFTAASQAAGADDLLRQWFAEQKNVQTWFADVTQTRTFKTLTQPLVSTGRVWFAKPNQFRWELGDPPHTIAVRQPEQMLVIYPRLKRAERFPLDVNATGPWKETLALLEAGFPQSQDDIEARFKIVSHINTNNVLQLVLRPRSPSARKLISEFRLEVRIGESVPRATELRFGDGATMRNAFTQSKVNVSLDASLFNPPLPEDYKITEPLRR